MPTTALTLARRLFGRPRVATPARRDLRARPSLLALESRDVPALYLVSLAVGEDGAGTKGDAGAEHSGSFTAATAYVEAETPAEAVSLRLSGSLTVTLPWSPGDTKTYTMGPGQVGVSKENRRPFWLESVADDQYKLWAEDLADISYCDWDYDDRYYKLTVQNVETVAGVMWTDTSDNGIQDNGEPLMLGLSVQLLKDGVAEGEPATTGDGGEYSINVIRDPSAVYTVQFEKPEGYTFTPLVNAGDDSTKDSEADPTGLTPNVFTSSASAGAVGGGMLLGALAQEWTVRAPETDEGSGVGQTHAMTFTVTRRLDVGQATDMAYTTIDGTATAGQDYVAKSGTLQFAAGQSQKTVTVTINEDLLKENDEEFFLVLKLPDFQAMPDGTTDVGRRTPFGRGIVRNDDFPAGYVNSWGGWAVHPRGTPDATTNYQNGTWMRGWDGDTPTYLTPTGTPWVHSMINEEDALKSGNLVDSFRFSVMWRTLDTVSATPMDAAGKYRLAERAEHFGNSGVYIYKRYEVQIIDPSKAPGGVAGVAPGGNIVARDDSKASQLTPGWPYLVAAPNGPYVNRANATGQWNAMEVEFVPGTIDPANIKKLIGAASLKVTLNGHVVYNSTILANGTGSRATYDALDKGYVFLQSHWGSQVEYKEPVILVPPTP